MVILARGVGRRKEAVAQVQIVKGTGLFLINNIPAQQYLHNNTCSILSVKSPFNALNDSTSVSRPATRINPPAEHRGLPVQGGAISSKERGLKENSYSVPASAGLEVPEGENTVEETQNVLKTEQANNLLENLDTIVKVKGGGLVGQAEAIKLGLARALCELNVTSILTSSQKTNDSLNTDEIRKQLKDKGYLTQDSRVKERRKYGLKKARKATQYNKR